MAESGSKNACAAANVGQDKPVKDFVDGYDAEYGKYKSAEGGKPTQSTATLPNTPSPINLKK
jgi:hypothetical protein